MGTYVAEVNEDPGHDTYWVTHLIIKTEQEGDDEREKAKVEKALQKPRTMIRHLHDWTNRSGGESDLYEEDDAAVAAEVQAELARRGISCVVTLADYVFMSD